MTEALQDVAGEQNTVDRSTSQDSRSAVRRSPIRWLRQHRGLAALAAVVATALGMVIWGQLAPKGDGVSLSVHNPGPEGARAVSEILGRHGVNVKGVDRFEEAMAALEDSDFPTLLLYDRNGYLDDQRLSDLIDAAQRVVVISPRLQTLGALDSSITQAGVVPESAPVLEPDCSLPDAGAAGQVTGTSGFVYDGGTSCYRPAGTSAGLLTVSGDGRVTVLGSTAILSNEKLDELGNAALALRTLGSSADLVWYLPSLEDLDTTGSPQTLSELAPDWSRFIGLWLALVALAAILWRGRRHGPLVFEPLPVVVKAVETAEGRARLYQEARAIGQARDNLRAGTLVRLARKLRLGPEATADEAAEAVARFLSRPSQGIKELLNEHPPTEARLVAWAQELNTLEKEVSSR
ncbi:hypothetical protein QF038_001323 [Pseudarthrobacter sp. W1I19]|uniref:DUF4350 domain-containing protein n=1 Tax=Pseudarthrobacter sp. W1I19 TaxID=3042288 RepID=UPI00277FD68D|nr:DUF4350 domain-containing protein [Pseudarthrobacter sp. W1I19]MDQ0922815.1 hypothetical protein [Pseudarthrobacter sp. W1I19]